MKMEDMAILGAAAVAVFLIVKGSKAKTAKQYGTDSPQWLIDLSAGQGVYESATNGGMSLAPEGWKMDNLVTPTPIFTGSSWTPARAYGSL